jgi:hypothetical protein
MLDSTDSGQGPVADTCENNKHSGSINVEGILDHQNLV